MNGKTIQVKRTNGHIVNVKVQSIRIDGMHKVTLFLNGISYSHRSNTEAEALKNAKAKLLRGLSQ